MKKKYSFYTKYRQYKFSKLVKVVTRTKAKFSINRWLHLYFSLKLHNIQKEHFSVLKKCKNILNAMVMFSCHYDKTFCLKLNLLWCAMSRFRIFDNLIISMCMLKPYHLVYVCFRHTIIQLILIWTFITCHDV